MPRNKLKLLIATTNAHKFREFRELFQGLPITCVSLCDLEDYHEVAETGRTFEENAKIKALSYAEQSQALTLAEDSGLCCDALEGAPGVFSARFSGELKSDDANNQKLLQSLSDVPDEKRTAYYESAIALAEPNKLIGVVQGQVRGVITRELRGDGGFGYDPLFFYPSYGKTFGEVPAIMKHRVSHRANAAAKVKTLLKEYLCSKR